MARPDRARAPSAGWSRRGWHYLGIPVPCTAPSAWPRPGSRSTLSDEDGRGSASGPRSTSKRARRGEPRVIVNGKDATHQLRMETAGAAAIAALPAVRAALVDLQRGFRRLPGLVADGRDMGTVIFPDAATKVFTASAAERAERR